MRFPHTAFLRALTLQGVRTLFTALVPAVLFCGCTSEPLISRKGVSGQAAGELGAEALLAVVTAGAAMGKANMPEAHIGNLETEDTNYIGGFVPWKNSALAPKHGPRVDNGTIVFVDGRKRGFLPLVTTLPKPGPHLVYLGIPVFEPYMLKASNPVRLRTPQGEIEAWPPIIVDTLTGEIFTTQESSAVNVERNSGTGRKGEIRNTPGRDPLLIVTTTDKRHPGWRKVAQMRVRARTAGP
jgi:hypothetical protein